jgi:Cu-Zn family superoxide dismutase
MRNFYTLMLGQICSILLVTAAVAAEGHKTLRPADQDPARGDVMDITQSGPAEDVVEGSSITSDKGSAVDPMKKSDSSEWGVARTAKVVISATKPGLEVSGNVDLVETGGGIQVVAHLSGVPSPGKHGFHIHEQGSCEDEGKAAGGHFNPMGVSHGLLPKDGEEKAHAGDMGNIDIDDQGKGNLVVFLPGLSLSQEKNNVNGRAVILHEKEDDFGQPTGNAGGRIGCGIITLNQ